MNGINPYQPLASEFEKTIQPYNAAEKLLAEGRVRAIGVSNLTPTELDRLITETSVVPAVNQIQVHPYYSQAEWRAANDRYGIITQCWSPLGGSYTYNNAEKNPFEDKVITDIARKHSKTPAQVILRWHLDHGYSAIPKSVKLHRIVENFDVFDFRLTANEIKAIDALETGVRGGLAINDIKEIVVQLYAYLGFPRALNALGTFMALVNERILQVPKPVRCLLAYPALNWAHLCRHT